MPAHDMQYIFFIKLTSCLLDREIRLSTYVKGGLLGNSSPSTLQATENSQYKQLQMALAQCIISPQWPGQAATLWPALLCFLLLLTSRAAGRGMSLTWSWEQEAQTFTRRLMAISSCPDLGKQVRLGQRIQVQAELWAAGWASRPQRHTRRDTLLLAPLKASACLASFVAAGSP